MDKWIGLTHQEAQKRLAKYGLNTLAKKNGRSSWKLLIDQLKSPLIYILLVAALMTFWLHDYTDTIVILAAVVMNTLLGFIQENKAQETLESLSRLLTPKAKIIRDNQRQIVDATQLVPGDIVILEMGSRIPADGFLVQADSLTVNEAILTGESMPVEKKAKSSTDTSQSTDHNLVFMGTIVTSGIGKMQIDNTGPRTKMGQIAHTLKTTKDPKTPLQKKIDELSGFLAIFIGASAIAVFLIGLAGQRSFMEMFMVSVALAVAAIPEGLTVTMTVILAVGMQRILKRKAVVRQMTAAETLGSVTTICTDKTGTLTEGKMQVMGTDFTNEDQTLTALVLCNDQRDPLEMAMLDWAQKQPEYQTEVFDLYPRLDELPFDPEHKYIATLHQKNKEKLLLVSGAPEVILGKSQISHQEKTLWLSRLDAAAAKGLRVVAFAQRNNFHNRKLSRTDIQQLTFLGTVYFEDPVRPGVKEALQECRAAGIKVKVITGDYKKTAMAILHKLGLMKDHEEELVVEGSEWEKLDKTAKNQKVKQAILFSRFTPWQKLEIVQLMQEQGEVIAMTGDGVNDAPAIKKADIGIVVEQASDVSKQTADMVLLDSNFATIVAAVEEGRGIFANIRKVILYLLADAFAEVFLVLASIFLKIPLPLTAAQILWINLISDGFPSLALTVEPKDKNLMDQPPRSASEPLVNFPVKFLIVLISLTAGLLTLGLFQLFLHSFGQSLVLARTVSFASLGVTSLFYVFSCRNLDKPIFKQNQLQNPWLIVAVAGGFLLQISAVYLKPLQGFLHTQSLSLTVWLLIIGVNLLVICLIEGVKWIFVRSTNKATLTERLPTVLP
jgi:Ca2+-transporting ATPase